MTWSEIYNKYKDTELMKEFESYFGNNCFSKSTKEDKVGLTRAVMNIFDIKDIWGYLICFAETKGYGISLKYGFTQGRPRVFCFMRDLKNQNKAEIFRKGIEEMEQAMDWCTDKFFEVANENN